MSRKKRALQRQKRREYLAKMPKQKVQLSPEKKAKQRKKEYYASSESKEIWEKKKASKEQCQLNSRISQGISVECPLMSWEKPSIKNCKGCKQKCSSVYQ